MTVAIRTYQAYKEKILGVVDDYLRDMRSRGERTDIIAIQTENVFVFCPGGWTMDKVIGELKAYQESLNK